MSKPQGKGILGALGQSQSTGRFNKVDKIQGKGVAVAMLQNKLAKRRGQSVPYTNKGAKGAIARSGVTNGQ